MKIQTPTLADLVSEEPRLRMLNHRLPSLQRSVNAVHLIAYLTAHPAGEPVPTGVLWILPTFSDLVHVEFDAWILQLAQSQSAGLVIPEARLAESTLLLADRLALPLFSLPANAIDDLFQTAWTKMTMHAYHALQRDMATIDSVTALWGKALTVQDFLRSLQSLGLSVSLKDESSPLGPPSGDTVTLDWGRGSGIRLQALTDMSARVIAHIRLLAAILLDREAGDIESQLRHRSEFLLELLVDPRVPTGSVIRAAEQFRLDLGRHHAIALWDLDAFEQFVSQGVSESSVLRLKSHLLQQLEKESQHLFGHGLVLAHSDEFVLIVESHEALTARQFASHIRTIQQALIPVLTRYRVMGITAGMGFSYTGVQGLRKSFEEAHEAMVVGRSRSGLGSVTHFADIGLERFLYGWIDSPRSQTLAQGFLDPLKQEPNGSELLNTLQIYLESRGRVSVASQALAIHRNTLRYRLEHINQILHIDVDDATTQLVLQLAFKALKMDTNLHKK